MLAVVFWLIYPGAYLNYDTFYSMLWGREILEGNLPDYTFPIAPTPHPLATLVTMLAVPFGAGADDILLAASFLCFGLLLFATYRLGRDVFSWPVGLFAAAIVATRLPIESLALRAYIDIPYLALVLLAGSIEVRKPKSGTPVLVLLGLAGLLRPEAWLIAGAYYLYLVWDKPWSCRIKYALLTAAAPLIWALTDLIVTGDALYSLHGTSELASQLDRPRSLIDLPVALPEALGYVMREPVLIAVIPGLIFAWLFYRKRQLVPLALAGLNIGTFVIFAIASLPLLARYTLVTATMLALYAGAAAVGWIALKDQAQRKTWTVIGVLVLVVFAIFLPSQGNRLAQLRETTISRGQMQEDIYRLTEQPNAKRYLKNCGTVYAPNHRLVPMLRYWLERDALGVRSGQSYPVRSGVMIAPRTPTVRTTFVLNPTDKSNLNTAVPDNYRRVAKNRSWALYASLECLRRLG